MMRRITLIFLALFAWSCSGGGGDGGGGCVDQVCAAGETACLGADHHVGTCDPSGLYFEVAPCQPGTHCEAGADGTATCVTNTCAPGVPACTDDGLGVHVCDARGAAFGDVTPCGEGLVCVHGTCVTEKCFVGEASCRPDAVVACSPSGSGWEVQPCGPTSHCEAAAGAAPTCVANACEPFAVRCEAKRQFVQCLPDGGAWSTAQDCPSDRVCVEGVCVPELCEYPTPEPDTAGEDTAQPDTAPPDTGEPDTAQPDTAEPDIPPLEVPDTGAVRIDGEWLTFSTSLSATYIGEKEELIVSMTEFVGVLPYRLEVHVLPVSEFAVGAWTHEDPSEVGAEIRLSDGTGEPGEGPESWKYRSTEYQVTITSFGAINGRVTGTFSGVLADRDGGPAKVLTEGSFDVKRSN